MSYYIWLVLYCIFNNKLIKFSASKWECLKWFCYSSDIKLYDKQRISFNTGVIEQPKSKDNKYAKLERLGLGFIRYTECKISEMDEEQHIFNVQ